MKKKEGKTQKIIMQPSNKDELQAIVSCGSISHSSTQWWDQMIDECVKTNTWAKRCVFSTEWMSILWYLTFEKEEWIAPYTWLKSCAGKILLSTTPFLPGCVCMCVHSLEFGRIKCPERISLLFVYGQDNTGLSI